MQRECFINDAAFGALGCFDEFGSTSFVGELALCVAEDFIIAISFEVFGVDIFFEVRAVERISDDKVLPREGVYRHVAGFDESVAFEESVVKGVEMVGGLEVGLKGVANGGGSTSVDEGGTPVLFWVEELFSA